MQRLRMVLVEQQQKVLCHNGLRENNTFIDDARPTLSRSTSLPTIARPNLDNEADITDTLNERADSQCDLAEISPRLRLGEPDHDKYPPPPQSDEDTHDKCPPQSDDDDPMVQLKFFASSVSKTLRCHSCIEAKKKDNRAEEVHINEFLGEVLAELDYTHIALVGEAIRDEHDLLELQEHLIKFCDSCVAGSERICSGCRGVH